MVKYLFPVKAMSKAFRAKFVEQLKKHTHQPKGVYPAYSSQGLCKNKTLWVFKRPREKIVSGTTRIPVEIPSGEIPPQISYNSLCPQCQKGQLIIIIYKS